jgi:hypothetical protein
MLFRDSLLVGPASLDRFAPLHADIEHVTRTPIASAGVTPVTTAVATISVIGTVKAVPVIVMIPVRAYVNATWTDIKLYRVRCS